MNWLDIVIIIFLGILTFWGLRKGLIGSLIPLVGIILGIVLAGRLTNVVDNMLSFIDNESVAKIVAFAIILIAVFIIVSIIGNMIKTILHLALLGWVDRLGGAAFGFGMGWFICAALIALLARYAALPVDLSEFEITSESVEDRIDVEGVPEVDLPDIRITGESLKDMLDLGGIRESVYNTIDDSELATLQLDSFPVVLDLLPGEFDSVRDFFDD